MPLVKYGKSMIEKEESYICHAWKNHLKPFQDDKCLSEWFFKKIQRINQNAKAIEATDFFHYK